MRVDRLLDTNFLILRWRGGKKSAASTWLREHADYSVGIPWIVKAEFLRGAVVAGHAPDEIQKFLSSFPVLWPDEALIQTYANLFSELRRQNQLIGPHDLWIAATALNTKTPLVTRNISEFGRIPGLRVDAY